MNCHDFDGFGVLYCEKCGYCVHASVNGGVCGLCGALVKPVEWAIANYEATRCSRCHELECVCP